MSRGPKQAANRPATDFIAPAYQPRQAKKPAPCQGGCPNCGDIRGWIGVVAQREKLGLSKAASWERAWRIITDVNPFPATLGRICPHPCEQHCNRSENDEPLAINAMEQFLGDFAIERGLKLDRDETARRDQWIGVVGAGPSGLSFAYQMARRGYRVTVYESHSKPGGMLRYGVPDYRLPQQVLDSEIERILDLGVELLLNTRIGQDVTLAELRERHPCLYLGIGAQQGRVLHIPGVDGPGTHSGTDYLAAVNRGARPPLGRNVVVIGGGNTAVDAARCARRSGAEVTLLYRRTRQEMPAVPQEVEDALHEGVRLLERSNPVAIVRDERKRPLHVRVQSMRMGEADASGRRRPVPVEGDDFDVPADSIIMAISQVPVLEGLDLPRDGNGWIVTNTDGSVSEDIVAGGDALGLGIAGDAIVQGRQAAEALHRRLSGENEPASAEESKAPIGPEAVRFDSKLSDSAVRKPERDVEERLRNGMVEVTGGIQEDQFLAEAQRCYSCGSCFGCEQCFMYCTSGCFERVEEPSPGLYFTLDLDRCQSCGKCIEVCPCGFLEPGS